MMKKFTFIESQLISAQRWGRGPVTISPPHSKNQPVAKGCPSVSATLAPLDRQLSAESRPPNQRPGRSWFVRRRIDRIGQVLKIRPLDRPRRAADYRPGSTGSCCRNQPSAHHGNSVASRMPSSLSRAGRTEPGRGWMLNQEAIRSVWQEICASHWRTRDHPHVAITQQRREPNDKATT